MSTSGPGLSVIKEPHAKLALACPDVSQLCPHGLRRNCQCSVREPSPVLREHLHRLRSVSSCWGCSGPDVEHQRVLRGSCRRPHRRCRRVGPRRLFGLQATIPAAASRHNTDARTATLVFTNSILLNFFRSLVRMDNSVASRSPTEPLSKQHQRSGSSSGADTPARIR